MDRRLTATQSSLPPPRSCHRQPRHRCRSPASRRARRSRARRGRGSASSCWRSGERNSSLRHLAPKTHRTTVQIQHGCNATPAIISTSTCHVAGHFADAFKSVNLGSLSFWTRSLSLFLMRSLLSGADNPYRSHHSPELALRASAKIYEDNIPI